MQITQKPSPNFDSNSIPNLGYVIHGTLGNYDGAVNWLCTPPDRRPDGTYSSAHFVIAKDGRVTQLINTNKRAWHAGTVSNPDSIAKNVLPKTILGGFKNPNDSFIGIELEWFMGDKVTDQQYLAMFEIIKNGGIKNPIILCHKQIASFKADFQKPDGTIDYTVVETLIAKLTPPAPVAPIITTNTTQNMNTNIISQIKTKMAELQTLINQLA